MDPRTGEVLAMVGSRNYFDKTHDGNLNATLTLRQPGSSIKPFVYLTGFATGKITPATLLSDTPTAFDAGIGQPPYRPNESDGKYWGPLLVRDALANSRNVPTVQVMQRIGLASMMSTATQAGITTYTDPSRYGLSLALGGGEVRMLDLVDAYATLATGGVRHDPVAILKVATADGKVLYEYHPESGKREFDPKYVYLVTNILSDNVARQRLFGAHNLLQLSRPAAVKTGTTDDNRDAWTVGYTPSLVTGVWVGNFDNTAMNGIEGATGATPIWHYYMERVLQGTNVEQFVRPEGIVEKPITKDGTLSCNQATTIRMEVFVAGTEPTGNCGTPTIQVPFTLPKGWHWIFGGQQAQFLPNKVNHGKEKQGG
jgi:membrane carboxypeptidase/penicillin-binding protein